MELVCILELLGLGGREKLNSIPHKKDRKKHVCVISLDLLRIFSCGMEYCHTLLCVITKSNFKII